MVFLIPSSGCSHLTHGAFTCSPPRSGEASAALPPQQFALICPTPDVPTWHGMGEPPRRWRWLCSAAKALERSQCPHEAVEAQVLVVPRQCSSSEDGWESALEVLGPPGEITEPFSSRTALLSSLACSRLQITDPRGEHMLVFSIV